MPDEATDVSDELIRPIIGIENRTAQEAFAIMVDRIRGARATLSPPLSYFQEIDKIGELREALQFAHAEIAVAIAFCGRGPGPTKIGEAAPAENWARMCNEISALLVEADKRVLAVLA